MPVIQTENLTKIYGDKKAVDDVSLSIQKGEVFTLLGANGSGKSTTVKMLTGLLKSTSGSAEVLSSSIFEENIEIKKKIGVLPEGLALFEGLSIWEHIVLTGEIYGLTKEETVYRGEQLLKHLNLWEKRETRINECSYGMKKKCSLAMALIHNPELIFLDEPFEGVDPISSKNIRDVIADVSKKNRTFFITSHNLQIMEKITGSLAIISNGKIVGETKMYMLKAENKSLEDFYFEKVKDKLEGNLEWLGQ